jgi:hypothetical protein
MNNRKIIDDLNSRNANTSLQVNDNFKELISLLLTNSSPMEMNDDLKDTLCEKVNVTQESQEAETATNAAPSITGDNNVNIIGDNNNDCNMVIMELISLIKERDKEIKRLQDLLDESSKDQQ